MESSTQAKGSSGDRSTSSMGTGKGWRESVDFSSDHLNFLRDKGGKVINRGRCRRVTEVLGKKSQYELVIRRMRR